MHYNSPAERDGLMEICGSIRYMAGVQIPPMRSLLGFSDRYGVWMLWA